MSGRANTFPPSEQMLAMYRRMLLIRRAEEQLAEDVKAGRTPGQVHLSDGQEAVAVGICAHLDARDQITSTHRGHGHFLAKGGDVNRMFAEIHGKAEGICGGMGGSMHVADFSLGIVGANGIVGAGMPIAAGAAFAQKLLGTGRIAVAFFGDGAANQGVLMECLNIAALWQLPLLFVCENNGFSEFSPAATVTFGSIADRARPFGMPVEEIDGNDLMAVWRTAARLVDHVRSTGPAFLEARTYRYSGHFGTEAMVLDKPYRSDAELAEWRGRDPIDAFRKVLADHAEPEALEAIEAEVIKDIAAAVAFAEAGTEPAPGTATRLIFAEAG